MWSSQGDPHAPSTIFRTAGPRPLCIRLRPAHLPTLSRPGYRGDPYHRPSHRLQPPPHLPRTGTGRSLQLPPRLLERRWAAWRLARLLAKFILDHYIPDGPVLLAGEDTVEEHPGARVHGKSCHRDPVRSIHSFTAYRWGHKWVVLTILVKVPFAVRPGRCRSWWPCIASRRRPRTRPRPGSVPAARPGPRHHGTKRPRN